MGGCKGPITTFIVEPFVPHNEEFYLNIVSERLGCTISFSECGGIEIEENWDKVCKVYLIWQLTSQWRCLKSSFYYMHFVCTLLHHWCLISFIQVKTIFVPTGVSFTSETCAPLIATLPLEVILLTGPSPCLCYLQEKGNWNDSIIDSNPVPSFIDLCYLELWL